MVVQPDQRVVTAGTAGGDFALHRDASSHPHDENFGDDGYVTTDFGSADDGANAVAIGPNGTVVAAGSSAGNVALVRYDNHGHPDLSYGLQGLVTTDLGAGNDAAYSIVVRGDGSVVAAVGTGTAGVLVGYRPDGSLDTGFGSGGKVLVNQAGAARAIAGQPDGDLVVVSADGGSIVVSRFTSTGGPDTGFGQGGVARISAGSNATGDAIAILPDGRLLVAGGVDGAATAWEFQSSGFVDLTFGVAGRISMNAPGPALATGVAVDPSGGVRVVGTSGASGGFTAQYSSSGTPEPRWGPDGVAVTTPPLHGVAMQDYTMFSIGTYNGDFSVISGAAPDPNAVGDLIDFGTPGTDVVDAARQADGSFVAVARVSGATGLVRFKPDGSLDTSFGRNGRAFTDLASWPVGLVVQANGRIVVLGSRDVAFALVRFTADGALDGTFGEGGRKLISTTANAQVSGFTGLPDGRLLLLGDDSYEKSIAVRTGPDGTLDPSFGTSGVAVGMFPQFEGRNGLLVQPDGKVLVSASGHGLVRMNVDGSPDATFGNGGVAPFQYPYFQGWSFVSSLLLRPDGSIVLGGTLNDYDDSALGVAHMDANGVVDTAWPPIHRSQFTYPFTRSGGPVTAMMPLGDGRVLAISGTTAGRLLPSGALDQSFGQLGLQRLSADAGAVADAWTMPDGALLTIGAADGTKLDVAVNRIGLPGTGNGRAWGFNGVGQLGTGDLVDRRVPAPVKGPANVTMVATGAFHGLELTADGSVWAWGWNGFGEIGDGTTINRSSPVRVPGLDHVVGVSAGAYHSLAVRSDGTVWAWGWNVFGQIGDGTTTDRHLPVQVGGAALVRQVAAGAFHSMALNASGLQTWGYNAYGQLGDGTNVDRHAPVDLVSHNSDGSFRYRWTAMTIAAGAYHSLATESDGRVLTWGWNGFGQLGDGTTMTRFEPALIQLGTGPGTFALSASAGLAHSAALRADGTVMTWGWNGAGQLGDGTTIDRHSPVAIGGAGESLQLSAGWVHTVSVRVDGSVQSWGWNAYGQLGTGSTVDRHVPGPVFGLSGADIVAAGPYQTLAL